MQGYPEAVFNAKVQTALTRIREILNNTRSPTVASNVHHVYDDKFLLAEFLTNTAFAAQTNALETLGLDSERLAKLRIWAHHQTIYLRLKAEETCGFDREEVHEVESGTRVKEIKSKGMFGSGRKTIEEKVITKVTKYFWKFRARYEILAISINDPSSNMVVLSGGGQHELVTSTNTSPKPKVSVKPNIDLNLNPLLLNLSEGGSQFHFSIDRDTPFCFTPRRNPEIDGILWYFGQFQQWCRSVHGYFYNTLFPVQSDHDLDLSMITDAAVFVPVFPLFEEPDTLDSGEDSLILSAGNINRLLNYQKRTLDETFATLAKGFPDNETLITVTLARLLVTMMHGIQLAMHYDNSIEYIEGMLYKQLVAAIGKVVTPDDFTEYMRFHNRKIFATDYAPIPFHHAIRRPEHYPEGALSIEQRVGSSSPESISTYLRVGPSTRPMHFLINAATKVSFNGDRFVHGWVSHQFAGHHPPPLILAARARQFSCFILMVGRIASADLFEPKHAIIIQNKDDLRIPLMLEQIPTPKEFKDAIESLSPEQQRFAKAYRGMQLESTLFGLCVIQIKPQLEKLLKLPDDSLTKEIKLTQELLELFITYQIPSDLISYAGSADATVAHKVGQVSGHVAKMYDMIRHTEAAELAEQRQKQAFDLASRSPDSVNMVYASLESHDYAESGSMPAQFAPPPPSRGPGGPPPGMSMGAPPPMPSAPRPMPSAPPSMAPPSAGPMPVGASRVSERRSAPKVSVRPLAPPQALAAPQPQPTAATSGSKAPTTPVDSAAPTPSASDEGSAGSDASGNVDYTKLPVELDRKFELLDEDSALRPTIIKPGPTWTLRRQKSLLSEPAASTLAEEEQRQEKNRAFDLLDALSRSGSLSLDDVSLHVLVAATHCFDKTLTETVIQRSINPIEKVERSALIVASTIQQLSAKELTKPEQHERLETYSPMLFPTSESSD